jgi:hypothetical protein
MRNYCYLCAKETDELFSASFALGPVCAKCREHPTPQQLEAAFQEMQNALDDLEEMESEPDEEESGE